ncbi:integrase/recombinase xerD homolog [Clytia hemisphaerica]|uniref:integrase/recombinase xerD homolog n=1 Tax=Clytia hemisphaerica TaxID=252671 RepID=UPI0034D6505C
MDVVREQLASKGVSEKSSDLIVNSRRSGTQSHYKSAWGKWASWCMEQKIDPVRCPVKHILDFLTDLCTKGLQYSTIGGYRSAISAFHENCDGSSIGEHPLVKRLMVGIFNKRPPQPRYGFTWDVETVLRYINGLDSSTIDIKLLSLKLTVLLALTGASRASELNILDTKFLSKYSSVYIFELDGVTKTQKPGDSPTKIKLFRFQENLSLCVCHTIDEFLSRTKERRGTETRLLISHIKPYRRVSTDTVSRWLKTIIGLAGIDTKIFKGHSTRSATTSKASSLGISVREILERANWTNESTFQKFYNRKIDPGKGERFQKALLSSFEQG